MSPQSLPTIKLNKNADRRLRAGHCWIYSNEIDNSHCALKSLPTGTSATVLDASGRTIGSAYFNSAALLCGRLYARDADITFESLFAQRIAAALQWRERCFDKPYYRLVYGDGDGLPGIVIDRYGDVLVVQLTSAGAMLALQPLVDALVTLIKPTGVLLRNDAAAPTESLDAQTHVVYGDVPEHGELQENGLDFIFPIQDGQKTGWFYDHRSSRAELARYVRGARVLDVYSYLGGWGLQALAAGAERAHFVDRSATALELLKENAQRQGVADKCSQQQAGVDDALKSLIADGEQFDVIVLDPPAFIKRRKDQKQGEKAYHHINQQAMRLLADGGLLVSASCSLHMPRQRLTEIVRLAANKRNRQASIVYQGGLGPDHPVLAAIPEMDYLKAIFARA